MNQLPMTTHRQTATQRVLSLLKHFQMLPEREITSESPAEDFFNVIAHMQNGTRAGALLLRMPSGRKLQLFVELCADMTHDDVLLSLTTAISYAMAVADGLPDVRTSSDAFSCYDRPIRELLWKLKYVRRRLRRIQKKFHNAEGRYHRALQDPGNHLKYACAADMSALQKRADECMTTFCDTFQLRQQLVDHLQDIVHLDAIGKEQLASLNDQSAKH